MPPPSVSVESKKQKERDRGRKRRQQLRRQGQARQLREVDSHETIRLAASCCLDDRQTEHEAVAKFIYTTFIAQPFYSKGISDLLSGCVGASAVYGPYRTVMWSLVYLRWRGAASLKRRLDEGQVTEDNRYELEGLSWNWVESYISTLR
ncbi:D-2-hydroxyacid dehydrogenase [Fusarium oxysporum f. sp. albedinis]|nr:D-2-hydroxyacid dehydrogenase [Fusarium oxysporum f. sp. albedinis]